MQVGWVLKLGADCFYAKMALRVRERERSRIEDTGKKEKVN